MGKASQKKKKRAADKQNLANNQSKKIVTKKTKKSKVAGKINSKKEKKITVAALEKKAAAVENALETTIKEIEKKNDRTSEQHGLKSYFAETKTLVTKEINKIKEGIDPERLTKLKKHSKKALKKGSYITVGIITAVALLLTIELHSNNRIYPGTKAGSIDIGYMPVNEAKEKISEEIYKYLNVPQFFTFEGNTFEVSADELGLKIAIDQTLARVPAFEFEKENPILLLATLFTERNVSINFTIDGDQIIKNLENNINLADKRAKNAHLSINEEGNFVVQAESKGLAINREKLINELRNKVGSLSTRSVTIELIEEEPQITAYELEKEKDRLKATLEKPITLISEENDLTIKLIDHLAAVSFTKNSSITIEGQEKGWPIALGESGINVAHANPVEVNSNIQIEIDEEKLEEYFNEKLYSGIEKETSPAKLFTSEEGNVVIEGKGEDGKSVPRKRLGRAIALAANNDINTVPVPIIIDHAPLTISDDLKEKGIKELIATGHSAYYGSPPNRMFNIEFGAQKYNGLLLAPGEEFSFNDILGNVDAASGFKPEKVIKENKLKLEYGGGICQVSTTLYRAALLAGLPITERKPHSWKVSYYGQSMGHGLDATIYPGVANLKFLNDTPGHLLVQAYTDGAEAYFKLYGTGDRISEMDGPYGGGLSYRWKRVVMKDGTESINEDIWTQYKPIPAPEPQPKPIAQKPTEISDGF